MTNQFSRVTENEVAHAVLQIALSEPNGTATFDKCRQKVPHYLNLSKYDRRKSKTRPNEEMWHQQIRNIKSHDKASGNYIFERYLEHVPKVGYRATKVGKVFAAN